MKGGDKNLLKRQGVRSEGVRIRRERYRLGESEFH